MNPKVEELNNIYNELKLTNSVVTSDVFFQKVKKSKLKITQTDIIEFILTKN